MGATSARTVKLDHYPIRLTVADDRQSWWAWAPSETEFCFGIASAKDDVTKRSYAGVGAPGPPESDRRWTGDMDPSRSTRPTAAAMQERTVNDR